MAGNSTLSRPHMYLGGWKISLALLAFSIVTFLMNFVVVVPWRVKSNELLSHSFPGWCVCTLWPLNPNEDFQTSGVHASLCTDAWQFKKIGNKTRLLLVIPESIYYTFNSPRYLFIAMQFIAYSLIYVYKWGLQQHYLIWWRDLPVTQGWFSSEEWKYE